MIELIRAELPPGKEILFDFGACRHCQFMARIKLDDILRVLDDERDGVDGLGRNVKPAKQARSAAIAITMSAR